MKLNIVIFLPALLLASQTFGKPEPDCKDTVHFNSPEPKAETQVQGPKVSAVKRSTPVQNKATASTKLFQAEAKPVKAEITTTTVKTPEVNATKKPEAKVPDPPKITTTHVEKFESIDNPEEASEDEPDDEPEDEPKDETEAKAKDEPEAELNNEADSDDCATESEGPAEKSVTTLKTKIYNPTTEFFEDLIDSALENLENGLYMRLTERGKKGLDGLKSLIAGNAKFEKESEGDDDCFESEEEKASKKATKTMPRHDIMGCGSAEEENQKIHDMIAKQHPHDIMGANSAEEENKKINAEIAKQHPLKKVAFESDDTKESKPTSQKKKKTSPKPDKIKFESDTGPKKNKSAKGPKASKNETKEDDLKFEADKKPSKETVKAGPKILAAITKINATEEADGMAGMEVTANSTGVITVLPRGTPHNVTKIAKVIKKQ